MDPLRAQFGSFCLDEAEAKLECAGSAVDMPPRVFQVLCELVRRAGQLVTKDALLDAVWGHRHVNEAALKNIVSQVRQALGDDAKDAVYIQTVSRRGYRFIASLGEPASAAKPTVSADASGANWLVGRAHVLARLQSTLEAARLGQRQIVFVTGEAGIGKSSLVERFIATAGVRISIGQCVEHYGGAEPYMPVLDALNGLCRSEGGNAIVELMRRVAPTWLLQLPWFVKEEDRREFHREAAGATQDRMLREFGEFVDRLTEDQPLLLVLEDLHWSDHATVRLLGYLARRRGGAAMMLVGTFRATELILQEHPLAGLRQELKPRQLCAEIDLEYLAETDLGEFLAVRLGTTPPEDFVRSLHSHTLGLPLFVSTVLEELLSSGKVRKSAEGWLFPNPDELTIPHSIAGVIESQLTRLSPEQQRALGGASVCGVSFLHLPLADVVRIPAEELQQLLGDAAARLPWLRSDGVHSVADGRVAARYAFTHAIYRQTLYERLPALQRVQWHRQWADALAALHTAAPAEVAAELALHFERGDAPTQAAGQLAVVATRAMAFGAPRECLLAAQHGLRLAAGSAEPALELELRSLEAVAMTREYVMAAPQVAAAFARARALGPLEGPAWQRTLQGCWWVHFALAEYEQARALADEMLAQAQQSANPALHLAGLNAMGIVLMLMGEFSSAKSYLERAVEAHIGLPEALVPTSFVQDPGVEAGVALILVYWVTGEPERARALARQAVANAASTRHPLSEATALYASSVLHALAGEFDTVYALTERHYALVREHALPENRSGFAWLHGEALVALGRADEGLKEMQAAADSARQLGLRTGLGGYYYHHALACKSAGSRHDVEASVRAGLAFAEEVGEKMILGPLLGLRAEIEMAQDDEATATSTWKLAISTARAQGALFHELGLHAAAQGYGSPAAEPDRLKQLLASYELDPSPVVANAKAMAARAGQTLR